MNRPVAFIVGAFLLWFVLTQPVPAAAITRDVGGGLSGAATSMATFVTETTGHPATADAETTNPVPGRPPGVYGDNGHIEIVPAPSGGVG